MVVEVDVDVDVVYKQPSKSGEKKTNNSFSRKNI